MVRMFVFLTVSGNIRFSFLVRNDRDEIVCSWQRRSNGSGQGAEARLETLMLVPRGWDLAVRNDDTLTDLFVTDVEIACDGVELAPGA